MFCRLQVEDSNKQVVSTCNLQNIPAGDSEYLRTSQKHLHLHLHLFCRQQLYTVKYSYHANIKLKNK